MITWKYNESIIKMQNASGSPLRYIKGQMYNAVLSVLVDLMLTTITFLPVIKAVNTFPSLKERES